MSRSLRQTPTDMRAHPLAQMRTHTLALAQTLALAVLLGTTAPMAAQAQERTPSHCVALASNPPPGLEVIPVAFGDALGKVAFGAALGKVAFGDSLTEAAFGDALAADSVRLSYVDHSTFLLETAGGLTAATDYTGYLGPRDVVPDLVTMNNAHDTHWTATPDPRIPRVLRGWADAAGPAAWNLDLGEMLVRNVTTDVRSRFGEDSRSDGNSIFIFEVAGLCVGHLGHLHHVPDDAQFAAIGRLDVVMVPVDGSYTMNVAAMADVVRRLRSSIVVPMHWFSGASLELFLAEMAGQFEVVRPEMSQIELSLDNLPGRPTILVLEPETAP